EDVIRLEARLRGAVVEHRRDVVRLWPEPGGVRVAEERNHVVAADDDHVLQAGVRGTVGADDVLDRAGDEVLRVRAAGRGVRLRARTCSPAVPSFAEIPRRLRTCTPS